MAKRIQRPWIWRDRPPNTVDGSRAGPFGNPFTPSSNTGSMNPYGYP